MSRNKVGVPYENPTRYVGPGKDLIPIIKVPRAPTSNDKKYSLGQFWLIGDNPTTGEAGELYYLCDFVAGVPKWCHISVGGDDPGIDTIKGSGGSPVSPDTTGNIVLLASTVANATNAVPLYINDGTAEQLTAEIQVGAAITGAPADKNDAGLCSFDDTAFSVDANGYVTLVSGSGPTADSVNVDFNTAPGTDPVVPTAGGEIQIYGNTVTNATNANAPVATHSRAANQFHIDVQLATEITGAPLDHYDAGLCSFDDTQFAVDANGYVTMVGGSGLPPTQTITGDGGTPVGPDASGDITFDGSTVANGTNAKPLYINDSVANTLTSEIQVGAAITGAPLDKNDAGLCSFDDTQFAVDANGYVTMVGGSSLPPTQTITGDGGTPVGPDASGDITFDGSTVANGTNAKPLYIDDSVANTLTSEIQVCTTVSSAPADKNDAGLSSYDSRYFTATTHGFVSTPDTNRSWITGNYGSYSNLSWSISAGVLTIAGYDGTALSATNPAYVYMSSNVTDGEMVLHEITANDTLTASDLTGNTFGTTASTAWATNMPFYLGLMADSTDANPEFIISRLPNIELTPTASTDIGDPSSAVADKEISVFALNDITETNYTSKKVMWLGVIQMEKDASDQWTFGSVTRPGDWMENHAWGFPRGQNGASATTYFKPNGGTAPIFSSRSGSYYIDRNGRVTQTIIFSGDGGTDGSGAVHSIIATPVQVAVTHSLDKAPIGLAHTYSITGGATTSMCIGLDSTDPSGFKLLDMTGNRYVENGDFSNGNRTLFVQASYVARAPVAT